MVASVCHISISRIHKQVLLCTLDRVLVTGSGIGFIILYRNLKYFPQSRLLFGRSRSNRKGNEFEWCFLARECFTWLRLTYSTNGNL